MWTAEKCTFKSRTHFQKFLTEKFERSRDDAPIWGYNTEKFGENLIIIYKIIIGEICLFRVDVNIVLPYVMTYLMLTSKVQTDLLYAHIFPRNIQNFLYLERRALDFLLFRTKILFMKSPSTDSKAVCNQLLFRFS